MCEKPQIMLMMKRRLVLVFVIALIFLNTFAESQISKPIAENSQVNKESNKFLQRRPDLDETRPNKEEAEELLWSMHHCYHNVHMRRMAESSSSIYGTPLIADLYSDGKKEILVPSFVHSLDAFDAETGAESLGWPAFHKSNIHGSPFMYDIDKDGIADIGIGTFDGEIIFFKDTGEKMSLSLYIPRLNVKRDWYLGLKDDPNDHDHLDIGKTEKKQDDVVNIDTNIITRRLKEITNNSSIEELRNNEDALSKKALRNLLQDGVETNNEKLTKEASDSFEVFVDDDKENNKGVKETVKRHEKSKSGVYEFDPKHDHEFYDSIYKTYADYDLWYDDQRRHDLGGYGDNKNVYLDAHIFSTPVIADIDGDGIDELIVSVTYMYDQDYYDNPAHKGLLPEGIDIDKYLAGGIVVFDLMHRFLKWSVHLDMTTKTIEYAAFMFASPSVLDINMDGEMEIIVGNSVGFIYVLDCRGETVDGWPKQMGSIEGRTLVDDFNGDGNIEIIAADRLGNVAMFDIAGNELWERHLRSAVSNSPTAGDVDGDGMLEIVLGTASGSLYVLNGATGADKAPFPFRVHGDIRSPITISKLKQGPSQQLIFMAFDGWMYIVDGETACVDAKDIGEDSYSMILVDNLNDNGDLDLLVTTMNGNIYMFETNTPYHPLNTWTSEIRGTTNLVSRNDWVGVYATKESRAKRDIRGDMLKIDFIIVDNRPPIERQLMNEKDRRGKDRYKSSHGPYNVTIILKNVSVKEMNSGSSPVIGVIEVYDQPGKYSLVIPCPKSMASSLIQIRMIDKNQIEFIDEFSLSFHMHWYKFIKWVVSLPFSCMALFVIFYKPNVASRPLPA